MNDKSIEELLADEINSIIFGSGKLENITIMSDLGKSIILNVAKKYSLQSNKSIINYLLEHIIMLKRELKDKETEK